MNRQDAKTPTTIPLKPWSDSELDDIRSAASSGVVDDPQAAIVDLVDEIDRRTPLRFELPACRERLTPPARAVLALLVRAATNLQLAGGQIQTAKALELRSMVTTWEPFDPEARFMNRDQRRRKGRKTFARITERGKEVLIAWEQCNVPESDYTPGIHPSHAER